MPALEFYLEYENKLIAMENCSVSENNEDGVIVILSKFYFIYNWLLSKYIVKDNGSYNLILSNDDGLLQLVQYWRFK